ncbi:uncharacterized protein LOC111262829 isoform X1 [Varroa jacobsoni]|uniref:uncharacterized protein LOC111262829 isoform X1 n=1 Tax=Varroa jacobsoni TaxID=62625 RepID=UPI000BF76C58|nr:uncharacterized protein LOC111262829 isoform X1 [Varroa jacobsoni]
MLLSKAVRFLLLVTTLNALKCTSANLPELEDPCRGLKDDIMMHIDDLWWQLKDAIQTVTEKTSELANDAMDTVQSPERRKEMYTMISDRLLISDLLKHLDNTFHTVLQKTGEFAQGAMDAMKHPERRRALLARITNAMNAQLQKISQHSWVEKMITMTNRFNHCLRRAAGTLRKAAYEIYNIFVEEFKGVNS